MFSISSATRRAITMTVVSLLVLSGCQSTGSGSGYNGGVGPGAGPGFNPLGKKERVYANNGGVYLDVAIPVFDPGLPRQSNGDVDYRETQEQNIWPEVRRLEAKRFAVNTRNAISKTKGFGAVYVTPDPSAMADLYVLGRINLSNTMETYLGIKVQDVTGKVWGEKDFKIKVSSGHYRDQRRKDKDPNAQIYTDIADWVYSLSTRKKQSERENIKLVGDVLYANAYSPEGFGNYLKTRRRGGNTVYSLNGLPADSNKLLTRVREYRAKDMEFIDGLQGNYDEFYATTDEAYRSYQKETLPIMEDYTSKRRKATRDAWVGIGIGILGVIAGEKVKSQSNTAGRALQTAAVLGSASKLYDAYGAKKDARLFLGVFDELGQNLDLQVSPQVRSFEEKEVELTGTAAEQYAQWRAHLFEIYKANETPDVQL